MEGSEGEGELKILVALPFSYKKELLLTSMCFEGYNQRKKSVLDIGQCYFSLNFSHFTMDQWNLCQRSEVLCELHLKTTHSQVVLKNPPASTGDKLDPWSGRIPSLGATLLSPCATTTEAQASILEPVLPREKRLCSPERRAYAPQREEPAQQQRPRTATDRPINKNLKRHCKLTFN